MLDVRSLGFLDSLYTCTLRLLQQAVLLRKLTVQWCQLGSQLRAQVFNRCGGPSQACPRLHALHLSPYADVCHAFHQLRTSAIAA